MLDFKEQHFEEFRILMPLEMDEYYRGQLFAVSETSKNETGGGDGVQVPSIIIIIITSRAIRYFSFEI